MAILELPAVIVRTVSGSPLETTSERVNFGDVLNYALATADTEYPIAIPLGAISLFFNTLAGSLTYSTSSGGPTFFVGPMATVELRNLDPTVAVTLYVKSSKDNDTLQVHVQS